MEHEARLRTWEEGLNRVVLGSILGVVLLVLVAGLWVFDPLEWRHPSIVGPSTTSPTALSTEAAADPLSDAEAVAAALSALTDDPAEGAATAAKQSLDAAVAFPPGSKLAPEVSSWAPDGIGGGAMNVVLSIPGQPDSRYVAVMIKEGSFWKVLGTLEQSEGPAA